MKTSIIKLVVVIAVFGLGFVARSQSIESMPAVVIKTVPEAGAANVTSGETEIKVTFSKEMQDKSWSLVGPVAGPDFGPDTHPRYDSDHKTWILKVKLQPGTTYAYWLNHNRFQNFKDQQGHPAVPYLLSFKTANK